MKHSLHLPVPVFKQHGWNLLANVEIYEVKTQYSIYIYNLLANAEIYEVKTQ